MNEIWRSLSIRTRRLMVGMGALGVTVLIGMQFHVSSQGDMSTTYPKGFRGGTCTMESEALLVGYSAYFIPGNYEIPEDAVGAMSVPVLCGKIPGPGTLDVTIDLLYPKSARERPLSLRLARMEGGAPGRTLLSVPATIYESGIITQAMRIEELGEYRLYLSGKDAGQADFTLEIPIVVGTAWHETALQLWPLFLLSMVAVFFYNFRRIFG
ncbi:hypothetical protein [Nitrosovibrio sp. Nv17]|uniref:hypothetical protein n=1 Tax=Nitrosovibrio sp. Nv17 TaxID=1855339 RepID=UPI000908732C|nr:hypothetical protein [Nitrosovibrio sp. Nv17]SFW27153.1 hypothetical protein SAMN05216414_11063 [Nitrosovibrio sp. Nv17]